MKDVIQQRFRESLDAVRRTGEQLADAIADAAGLIADAVRAGGGVYLFGNGGSAADAQHIAGELVNRFLLERKAIRSVALTTDTSVLTSIANDYEFNRVYARQIEALGRAGDVAVGLSTSGNSASVVSALATAREMGMKTIAMTGAGGGACAAHADILLAAESTVTARVQEAHQVIYHVLCELVEAACA
jgi:D-sedoheptulose 7-phosphate isomerase